MLTILSLQVYCKIGMCRLGRDIKLGIDPVVSKVGNLYTGYNSSKTKLENVLPATFYGFLCLSGCLATQVADDGWMLLLHKNPPSHQNGRQEDITETKIGFSVYIFICPVHNNFPLEYLHT